MGLQTLKPLPGARQGEGRKGKALLMGQEETLELCKDAEVLGLQASETSVAQMLQACEEPLTAVAQRDICILWVKTLLLKQ